MVPSARATFNANFTDEKYQSLLASLREGLPKPIEFRIAETPIFVDADFRDKLISAGDDIIATILRSDFKELTQNAIPEKWKIPNENDHSHFIALDFGVCKDADGKLVPKLIEMQGFPSLFGFQAYIGEKYAKAYDLSEEEWTVYFNGLEKDSYIDLLKTTILGPYRPEEVVLMDVNAYEQKTGVDFFVTQNYIGIPIVSLQDLKQLGNQLFYELNGELKLIKRIYNRLIFDEIENNEKLLSEVVDLRQPLDVEWITHPNWFYRISKYTMPYLTGEFIPKTYFLDKLETIPADLENYVLKPLFSFAGQGVIIDVKQSDIEGITDTQNWILQEKVEYEPAIKSPEGGVKAEIRLLYLWPDGDAKPTLAINLARLSRGKMIGVRYNKDFDWVGGNIAFMEK